MKLAFLIEGKCQFFHSAKIFYDELNFITLTVTVNIIFVFTLVFKIDCDFWTTLFPFLIVQ